MFRILPVSKLSVFRKANVIILRSIRSTPGAKGGISCPKGHASKGRGGYLAKLGVLLRREMDAGLVPNSIQLKIIPIFLLDEETGNHKA